VQAIGEKLMTHYVVPLETIGLLLTAALVGAVLLARPQRREAIAHDEPAKLFDSRRTPVQHRAGGALTRRNAILVLVGIELMLNAANLNSSPFGASVRIRQP